jgi:hypothetical protein
MLHAIIVRHPKIILSTFLLLTFSALFGQINWRANTLSNKILFKRIDLRSSGIDTVLLYECDSVGIYKNADTTKPCKQNNIKFAFLFWRQNGKTFMQQVTCSDTVKKIEQVDDILINFFFDNKISSKERKKEIAKYHKRKSVPHYSISLLDTDFYYLTLYYDEKEHNTFFTSNDINSSFWRQFKMFDTEIKWAELINKKVFAATENNGM